MVTTSKKTTASAKSTLSVKPTAAKPEAAKIVPKGVTSAESLTTASAVSTGEMLPVPLGHELKKKELIERIVTKSGLKRRDVKPVVEAILDVLGTSIGKGETLNLQPMGKLIIKRTKDVPNAKISVCRIRQRRD